MAFSYVSERESRWGSWGHLESLQQIGVNGNYMIIAPKYQALLDVNISKGGIKGNVRPGYYLEISPNPCSSVPRIIYGIGQNEYVSIKFYNILGQEVETLFSGNGMANNKYTLYWNVTDYPVGIYFCKMVTENIVLDRKIIYIR